MKGLLAIFVLYLTYSIVSSSEKDLNSQIIKKLSKINLEKAIEKQNPPETISQAIKLTADGVRKTVKLFAKQFNFTPDEVKTFSNVIEKEYGEKFMKGMLLKRKRSKRFVITTKVLMALWVLHIFLD